MGTSTMPPGKRPGSGHCARRCLVVGRRRWTRKVAPHTSFIVPAVKLRGSFRRRLTKKRSFRAAPIPQHWGQTLLRQKAHRERKFRPSRAATFLDFIGVKLLLLQLPLLFLRNGVTVAQEITSLPSPLRGGVSFVERRDALLRSSRPSFAVTVESARI